MRCAVAVVRGWELAEVDGERGPMNAASLMKQVLAHLALELIDDLDEPIHGPITTRHVLSHTTGLPNWRAGDELAPLRPPGLRWGYSGEGFVLLQTAVEARSGRPLGDVARDLVFGPLGMSDSRFDDPEPGFHGYRPLITTARDYGAFLAHQLTIDDERWQPQWRIDDHLAWGAGWGLELGPPVHGWQWGSNPDASNFVIGCPSTGDGVVVLTDSQDGAPAYRDIVRDKLAGEHPALDVSSNPRWLELFS